MKKAIPKIQSFMSAPPITINAELNLVHAKEFMHKNNIRHLPVLKHGNIVGIISEKDINLIESFKDIDLKKEKVSDAMTAEPYVVSSDAHLDQVCQEMARYKYGSVLVENNEKKLIGIFTWIDALNAMNEIIN